MLATDGAQDRFDRHGTDWTVLHKDNAEQLRDRLDELQRQEVEDAPHGREHPRAKRRDDKTVVVWTGDDPLSG